MKSGMGETKKTGHLAVALAIACMLGLSGCYYDIEEELYPTSGNCDTTNSTYTVKVEPVIRRACYSCHGTGINLGGITLEGVDNLRRYADNGQLLGSIEHRSGFSPMPKSAPKLSECEIGTINAWINAGKP